MASPPVRTAPSSTASTGAPAASCTRSTPAPSFTTRKTPWLQPARPVKGSPGQRKRT